MDLKITWGLPHDFILERERKRQDPYDDIDQVPGFTAVDLEELRALGPDAVEVELSTEPGSVGKGAAGYGITLLIGTLAAAGAINTLVQFGEYALRIIAWIRDKTDAGPVIADPDTLGAVAAASADESTRARLTGCRFRGTVPITASLGAGTDERDIWAACFDGEWFGVVIFMSPSGTVLGTVVVPAEWGFIGGEWRMRTPEEIAAWWDRPSGPGSEGPQP